jgi:peptide methionine sulfoxide reductase MsrA
LNRPGGGPAKSEIEYRRYYATASRARDAHLGSTLVTEVAPMGEFWKAEAEHQDYLERNAGGYTCHFARPNWVLPGGKSAMRC